jgi:hypothetical protein
MPKKILPKKMCRVFGSDIQESDHDPYMLIITRMLY